jgi:hypothetical protein
VSEILQKAEVKVSLVSEILQKAEVKVSVVSGTES